MEPFLRCGLYQLRRVCYCNLRALQNNPFRTSVGTVSQAVDIMRLRDIRRGQMQIGSPSPDLRHGVGTTAELNSAGNNWGSFANTIYKSTE